MYEHIGCSKICKASESGKFGKPSCKYSANERISIFMQLEWKFLKCLLKEIQQPKEINVL